MKFHKQKHLYSKELGTRGSCYPTVLACLLDLELDEVPNFHLFYWNDMEIANYTQACLKRYCDGNYETAEEYQQDNYDRTMSLINHHWLNTLTFWLYGKGYKEKYIDATDMNNWLLNNKDVPYMVSGESKRGVSHVVIYMNGQMIHDPHPSNDGLKDESSFFILSKI